jgi:hypothetical protein
MSAKKSLSEFMGGVTVFGELTLLREVDPWTNGKDFKRRGIFICSCGKEKEIDLNNVKRGLSTSCGCVGRKRIANLNKTHGMSKSRIYGIYYGMKDRCLNEADVNYPNYGGRGVKICDRWLESFENFYADMIGSYAPKLSLDRIDVNGNYEKNNCRWATRLMQANNRRNSPKTNINGEDITLAEFAAEMGIKYHYVYNQAVTLGKGLNGLIEEMEKKLEKFKATSAT